MIDELSTYKTLNMKNHLSKEGLRYLVKLLEGKIKDFKPELRELTTHDNKAVKRLIKLGRDTPKITMEE